MDKNRQRAEYDPETREKFKWENYPKKNYELWLKEQFPEIRHDQYIQELGIKVAKDYKA